MSHVLHGAELAAWIGGALASGIATAYRKQTKRALFWLGVAGLLCNVALVVKNL